MPGMLDSLLVALQPDAVGKISHATGVDPTLIQRGFAIAAPLVLSALAKASTTPQGAQTLLHLLRESRRRDLFDRLASTNVMEHLDTGAWHVHAGDPADSATDTVFGAGATAAVATLTQHLGFNMRPLLGIAAQLALGMIANLARSKRLDAQQLSDLLRAQNDAFMKHPANRKAAGIVFTALAATDRAQALREMFDTAEWLKVQSGPLAALYCISNASPCGSRGLAKEFAAATDAVTEAARAAPPVSLLGTAFGEGLSQDCFARLARQHPQMAKLLSELHDSIDIVARKSPSDAEAYREIILFAAQRAAEAGKEGGFLGIGGTRVSVEEQRAIDAIRSALW
ncbi:MAG TPA: DUF937 domain-containing protein [Steroidobacteraceae bacterium]